MLRQMDNCGKNLCDIVSLPIARPACTEHTLEYLDMTVILGVWSQSLAVIIIAFPLGRHIASEAKFLLLHLDDRTWFKRVDCVHCKLTQRCTEPVPTFRDMLRQMDKCGKNLYTALIWRFHPGTLEWYPNPCFGGLTPIDPHFWHHFKGYLPGVPSQFHWFIDVLKLSVLYLVIPILKVLWPKLFSVGKIVVLAEMQRDFDLRKAGRSCLQQSWYSSPSGSFWGISDSFSGNESCDLMIGNNLDDSIEHDVCYQTSNWLLCTDMIQMWLRGIRMTQDLPMTFCEIHPSSTFLEGNKFQHQTYWASLQMSSTETRQNLYLHTPSRFFRISFFLQLVALKN